MSILEQPRSRAAHAWSHRLAHLPPAWFSTVMGTGILAVVAAALDLDDVAAVVWALSTALLVVVATGTVLHVRWHPVVARAHLHHPVRGPFVGAVPMALLTVAAGAVLVGQRVVGESAAVALALLLWPAGTALGLVTALAAPSRLRALRGAGSQPEPFAGWLMPVVPPMVSAATGPLLLPVLVPTLHGPLLLLCAALFCLTLVLVAATGRLLVRRVRAVGLGPVALAPTWWIVLGPLGQSVTAAHHLGVSAPPGVPGRAIALAYGLPVLVLALAWLGVCVAVTARALRAGLPFALTWWAFTFPVGTVVTGTLAVADLTGWRLLHQGGVLLAAALAAAWVLVASRTARGAYSGSLLSPS